jgi:hypothetical protein
VLVLPAFAFANEIIPVFHSDVDSPPLIVLDAPLVPRLRGIPRWEIRVLRAIVCIASVAQGCACGSRVARDERGVSGMACAAGV